MRVVHPVAGTIALVCVCCFWLSTVAAEILAFAFGGDAMVPLVVAVKTAIPFGFIILVPALIATTVSGFRLNAGRSAPLTRQKQRRMPFIIVTGVVILIPSAIYLAAAARAHSFGNVFILVQAIELIAGAVNISLLRLNMRDGQQMKAERVAAQG